MNSEKTNQIIIIPPSTSTITLTVMLYHFGSGIQLATSGIWSASTSLLRWMIDYIINRQIFDICGKLIINENNHLFRRHSGGLLNEKLLQWYDSLQIHLCLNSNYYKVIVR